MNFKDLKFIRRCGLATHYVDPSHFTYLGEQLADNISNCFNQIRLFTFLSYVNYIVV